MIRVRGGEDLKRKFVLIFLVVLILSACNSSELSFSEISIAPKKIEKLINSNLKLQLINEGTKGSYIIYHTSGEIEADLKSEGSVINIIFKELSSKDDVVKRNIYYLTMDSKHDTINVLVNDEVLTFDEVTGI